MTVLGASVACTTDPYERYATTVHKDVDQSAATLARTTARLQRTVVHGHVPLDSARVWSTELARAATSIHERAAHLAKVGAPDLGMALVHDGLLRELTGVADTVASLSTAMADCASRASPPMAATPRTAVIGGATRNAADDSLAALDAQIDSEALAAADSIVAACRTSVGDAASDLTRRLSYAEDLLRWTRQRAARKLATHGVLLGDVSLRRQP
jgi:hypothetical protein